ncbi:MAG: D-glucuronyl C5-epimerase family protein [Solirubrobacteraceae bacterium]
MRGRLLIAIILCAGSVGLGLLPSGASAASVVVLGARGHAVQREDPFVTLPALTPAPATGTTYGARAGGARAPTEAARAKARAAGAPTVRSQLTRLYRTHAITRSTYRRYSADFDSALASVRRLGGTRGAELEAVIQNLHDIAAGGLLTVSRLPALFETLQRNRQWWSTGPLLSSGQRVEFAGSELVWEYYPGQGIQLQELGSFGKADGLYTAGPADYPRLRRLLAEIIPLGAVRGGGLTWEYYFNFDGGSPPWTSAMSQGTALEALTRAYKAFHDPAYLRVASRALPIFGVPPPVGVGVSTRLGTRYLQYSFAPARSDEIINAFLQTLIGLHDFAHASRDPRAARLFARGDAQARAELPQYDTGAWSLYQPGQEDTLDYHVLVTGFLHELCGRTHASAYCTTARHFDSDLKTPPSLELLTHRARLGRDSSVDFRLSKYSHVGIVVVRGGRTVFLTSADFPYGSGSFAIPPLSRRGRYTIRLAATDLAGNFHRIVGSLSVS